MWKPPQTNAEVAALRRQAGEYLKTLREEAGLTQLEVAKAVGLDNYTTVSQIERGTVRLPPERMDRWAKALRQDSRKFAGRLLVYYDPHMWRMLFPMRQQEPEATA